MGFVEKEKCLLETFRSDRNLTDLTVMSECLSLEGSCSRREVID